MTLLDLRFLSFLITGVLANWPPVGWILSGLPWGLRIKLPRWTPPRPCPRWALSLSALLPYLSSQSPSTLEPSSFRVSPHFYLSNFSFTILLGSQTWLIPPFKALTAPDPYSCVHHAVLQLTISTSSLPITMCSRGQGQVSTSCRGRSLPSVPGVTTSPVTL